jgi:ribosomal protein S18 acetylase RimI-like enzyme
MVASSSSSHRVRAARIDDLAAILDIEARAFEPARRSSRPSLRRALLSGFQRMLVLEVAEGEAAGKLVGYLVVWPFPFTWRIYNLASDPSERNRGVGGALLAAAVDEARRAGAAKVVLESRKEPGLLRFYQQRGFRASRELADYYAEGEDAVRMELPLLRT